MIYHGDCLEVLADFRLDVIITDPPYGIGWSGRSIKNGASGKAHPGIANDRDTSVRDAFIAAHPFTPAVLFGSFYAPYPAGLRQVLVWHKPSDAGLFGSTTGYRRDAEPIFLVGPWPNVAPSASSVLRSCAQSVGNPSSPAGQTGHPHAKPVDLMRKLIAMCPPGQVADPFMGSGSTLRAAKDLGRPAIGIELDERYCEVAAKRLSQGVLDFDAPPSIEVVFAAEPML